MTFVVGVPVARAWDAFADGEQRSQWEALRFEIDPRPGGLLHWELPGLECDGRVEEVDEHRLLRHVELTGPHASSEVTVTFESVDAGTRITITHAGFGDSQTWRGALGGLSIGWSQAVADLVLYLQTGLAARRFTVVLGDPGARLADTPAGVEVREVAAGGCAEQAGMQAGDVVLTVCGAPVFTSRELWVMLRSRGPGGGFDFEYARGNERLAGAGTLGVMGS
jgi:uncharacterized protein YndB with AHSA1/START domain